MGKCKVRDEWFEQEDSNGFKIKYWATKLSDTKLYCSICMTKFSVSKGFQAVTQHSSYKQHKQNCAIKLSDLQMRITPALPATDPIGNASRQSYANHVEEVKEAEAKKELKKQVDIETQKREEAVKRKLEEDGGELATIEISLKKKKEEHLQKTGVCGDLLKEANERLKRAVQSGDKKEILRAQLMMDIIVTNVSDTQEEQKNIVSMEMQIEEKRSAIDKKRTTIITKYFKKTSDS